MYHRKSVRHLHPFAALALACVVFNTGSAWATDGIGSDANNAPTNVSVTTDVTETTTPETATVDGTGKTENSDNVSGTEPLQNDTLTPSSPSGNSAGTAINEGNLIYSAADVSDTGLVISNSGATLNGGVLLGSDAANLGYYPLVLVSDSHNAVWLGASASAMTSTTVPTTILGQEIGSLTSSLYNSQHGANLVIGGVILTNTLAKSTSCNGCVDAATFARLDTPPLNVCNNLTIADTPSALLPPGFLVIPCGGGGGQAPSNSATTITTSTTNNPPAVEQPRSYMINIGGVDVAITQMVLISGGKAYYCPPPDPDATGPIVYDVRTLPLYSLGLAPIDNYNFATALSSATPFDAPNSPSYLAAPTPEPSTLGIVVVGVLGLLGKRRRS